ncbi:hypothetical protein B0H34DRAFT_637384, partial [Crassisporium funariophilum]
IACKLCKAELKLTQKRDHVGKHILLALRVRDADFECMNAYTYALQQNVPSIGPNPCGWCGQEGKCKTHLTVRPGKSPSVLSDCEYHYAGLRYFSACTSTQSSPCTNVPLQCSMC